MDQSIFDAIIDMSEYTCKPCRQVIEDKCTCIPKYCDLALQAAREMYEAGYRKEKTDDKSQGV